MIQIVETFSQRRRVVADVQDEREAAAWLYNNVSDKDYEMELAWEAGDIEKVLDHGRGWGFSLEEAAE